ncbi:MAG: hypothetical protein AAFQ87_16915, partial [Bacteroidota bacterium]
MEAKRKIVFFNYAEIRVDHQSILTECEGVVKALDLVGFKGWVSDAPESGYPYAGKVLVEEQDWQIALERLPGLADNKAWIENAFGYDKKFVVLFEFNQNSGDDATKARNYIDALKRHGVEVRIEEKDDSKQLLVHDGVLEFCL